MDGLQDDIMREVFNPPGTTSDNAGWSSRPFDK
jgi:hypothetical protein